MSICSPNIYLNFDWSVLDDLHGSDNFLIKMEEIELTNEDHHSRWNLNKANWENFMELCNEKLKPEMFKTADDIQAFTDTLIHIAENVFRSPRHVQKEIDLGLITMLKIQ